MTVTFADRLRTVLPSEVVIVDRDLLAARSTDSSRIPSDARPAAIVRARSTADVAAALAEAHAAGVPVVAQGGLSGLVGAAAAIDGGLLLDMSGMNAILRIDPIDRIAVVEPGVIVADLQRAAAAEGLLYAPDPASAELATIGGTIATNAGGMRCIKYGVTRDAVRSLEIVLADGTVTRTRIPTVKGVAGLDITSLVVGSEGTLAVVTEATLALHPAPGPGRGVAAAFPSAASALAAADELVGAARLPSTLEYLDDIALSGIRAVRPDVAVPEGTVAWLLAVTDETIGADEDVDRFVRTFRTHGATQIQRADDPASLEELLAARRALSPGLNAVSGGATHGDLAVPRSQLAAFVAGAGGIRDALGVRISLAGHVGDGNLHPTVVFDPGDAEEVALAQRAAGELLALAQRLGGTVAGEHGIGTIKLHALPGELSPEVRALQRRIKSAFDPDGILNPGRKV